MKNCSFLKIVMGSAIGYLLVTIFISILSGIMLGGIIGAAALAGSAASVTEVPENAILDINFENMVLTEQTTEANPFDGMTLSLGGADLNEMRNVGILDAVKAIARAAEDPDIKCLYIRPDQASGISRLEELREAIVKFRESGKSVIAYIQTPTNAGYYLASAADRVYISTYHGGMNMMVGLSSRLVYYKDLLDLVGVNMQLIRHGKYKSAGEPYIRSTPSAENIEQTSVMINSIWKEITAKMGEKASISADEFNALLDDLKLVDADDFVKYGLADEAVTLEQMKAKLCTFVGEDEYEDVESISLADYVALTQQPVYFASEKIAVIYADGEIIDGDEMEEVAGKRFAKLIGEAADDDAVKGIVLRVNSPGGSVIASSQIKDALDAAKAAGKPIIASYGDYAASGGYWISACSDYIFSDATTLTGSIGVFGVIPDFSKAVKKLAHLNVYSVSTNKHADMYGKMRPMTGEEHEYVQKDIEHIYKDFTSLVAEGRKMSVEDVDNLGQGRVWTGRDALERGLVDKIGGLADAIEYTAALCGCGSSYAIESYPRPLTVLEQIMASFEPAQTDELVKAAAKMCGNIVPEEVLAGAAKEFGNLSEPKVYARLPYFIDIR